MPQSNHPNSIVSLAPSATSTLQEMNALERVTGVTAHSNIDDIQTVGEYLNVDLNAIAALEPDLILTAGNRQKNIRDTLRNQDYTVSHTAPQTLQQVLHSFVHIGDAIGRREAAETVAWEFQTKLSHIQRRLDGEPRPTVYCEEWTDPPMAAGKWVPDAVRIAGGKYPFVEPGERSTEVPREAIEVNPPDHVFVHVSGFGTSTAPETVTGREWSIPAIDDAHIHIMDDSFVNQPSPTLIEGINRMAQTLHPDVFLG